MKKVLLFFALLFAGFQIAAAQSMQVSGKVTYADDGSPVIGATVRVLGTQTATLSDVNGMYKITVPGSATSKVLVASFAGLKEVQTPVTADGQVIDFALKADAQQIETVVVTAQGQTRSQRSVGFATAVVDAESLTAAQSPSLMSGVQGKVAGINISQSGGAGTSQKVIVRGYSSLGSNQPLYVVDGVPINNSFFGVDELNQAVDFGNQANDINPNDVASMTILKGASATALYGSRAANGVVLITTKGMSSSKFAVSYDGSFMGSSVLRTPAEQSTFGGGWGIWSPSENGSWGPRYDGRMHEWGAWADYSEADGRPAGFTPLSKPFSSVKDNIRDFYKTGFEMSNNISVSLNTGNAGVVISYGNVTSDGVLPNNGSNFERNTVSVRGYVKHNKFSAEGTVNYVRKDISQTPGAQGGIYGELYQHAGDVSYKTVRDYHNENFNFDNYYTWYAENPYQVAANNRSTYQDDRVYGKLEAGYEFDKHIKLTARMTGDFANARQKRWTEKIAATPGSWNYGNKGENPGSYGEYFDNVSQLDATMLATFDYKVAQDKIGLGGFVGWNFNQRSNGKTYSRLQALDVPNWYSLLNGSVSPESLTVDSRRRLMGAMAQFDFSYDNLLFVSFTARNDWSSTLPINDNSFFYWGANAALIFSDLFKMPEEVNLLKLRVAYGQTGNDASPYLTMSGFRSGRFQIPFGYLNLPLAGVPGLTEYDVLGNNNLRPEITSEFEVGVSGNFFDNRLRFDVGYYDKMTKDQIVNATMAPETGYTNRTMNVGKISNKGIEAMLGFTPVSTKNWNWDVNITFSKNYSKVKALWNNPDGTPVTELSLAPVSSTIKFGLVVGQEVGVFRFPAFKTVTDKNNPNYGKAIVDGTGRYQLDANQLDIVGSAAADFRMGFNTTLSYKGLSLGATLDWSQGGLLYSNTKHLMAFTGNGEFTTFNERQPFMLPNTVKELNGNYVENDIPLLGRNGTNNIYNSSNNPAATRDELIDKSYVKLRELVVSYRFPSEWLGGEKRLIKGLSLSLIGRNLFMWTPADNKFVDPETSNFGNDITSEFGEYATAPSTRTFGGSIKITF